MSISLAEDIVSMRHGAHEEEEIDRKMELAIPCGLRPDSDAVTVAIESPEEKKEKKHLNRITSSGSSKQLSNGYGSTAIPEPRSPRSRRLMRGAQLLAGSNRLLWRRT